jgi:Protein of unknown function (DUF541)
MRMQLIFLLTALASAQTPPKSVTVTASKNSSLQPDQVLFQVDLVGPTTTTLDDAVAALQGSGITAANFASVNTTQLIYGSGRNVQPSTQLRWSFTLPVDLANLKTTAGTLTAVQQSVAGKNNSLSVAISVAGTQVSTRLAQSQTCSVADLLSDARAQAQKIASAAGLGVGAVLSISSATQVTAGASYASFGGSVLVAPTAQPVCSIVVKFALGGI